MKKTKIGISLAIIFLVVIFVVYLFLSQNKKTKPPEQITEITPTPISFPTFEPTTYIKEIKALAVNPQDKMVNVPIDSQIVISFNTALTDKDVIFSIGPNVPFTRKIENNELIITFTQPLEPGTLYTYVLKYPNIKKLPQVFTFATSGPTQQYLPNTYPGPMD